MVRERRISLYDRNSDSPFMLDSEVVGGLTVRFEPNGYGSVEEVCRDVDFLGNHDPGERLDVGIRDLLTGRETYWQATGVDIDCASVALYVNNHPLEVIKDTYLEMTCHYKGESWAESLKELLSPEAKTGYIDESAVVRFETGTHVRLLVDAENLDGSMDHYRIIIGELVHLEEYAASTPKQRANLEFDPYANERRISDRYFRNAERLNEALGTTWQYMQVETVSTYRAPVR